MLTSQEPTLVERLRTAVEEDEPDLCRRLIEDGAPVQSDSKSDDGRLLMHIAALNGYVDVAKALRVGGAQIDPCDQGGRTPLHLAAYKGHAAMCSWLAEQGADLERQDACIERLRPLHISISQRYDGASEALIAAGANVNSLDGRNRRPLDMAYHAMNIQTLEQFIRAGADLAPGPSGWERYILNNMANMANTSQALFLIAHGAQVCPKGTDGDEAIFPTRKINARDPATFTPKTAAARGGHTTRLLELLKAEPEPASRKDHIANIIGIADRAGHTDCVYAIRAHVAGAKMRRIRESASQKVQGLPSP